MNAALDRAARLEGEADRAMAAYYDRRASPARGLDPAEKAAEARAKLAAARALRPLFPHGAVVGPTAPTRGAAAWDAEAARLSDLAYVLAVRGREVESEGLLSRAERARAIARRILLDTEGTSAVSCGAGVPRVAEPD